MLAVIFMLQSSSKSPGLDVNAKKPRRSVTRDKRAPVVG